MSDSQTLLSHPIAPCYREDANTLILGSFPSVRSRQTGFYYGHPQNRFWKVLAAVYSEDLPEETLEKKELLYRHCLALWDVVASCHVDGSADSTIRQVTPNDLSGLLQNTAVTRIFVNGRTAEKLYRKYLRSQTGIEAVLLPSTSAANASVPLDRLIEQWKVIAGN